MNEIVIKENVIQNMIYEVRGIQVMLDSDSKLYGCINGTKDINKAVKRNIDRFPENFMFQLTVDEYENLRFQFGTSRFTSNYGGRRYLPYVFTEYGITMLAGVLKSKTAIEMSLRIVNTFIFMRKYISTNLIEQKLINNMVLEHESEIKLLQESFDKLDSKKLVNEIYFNGQIYDAYSKIKDILNDAKEELIIIDGYSDKTVLDMIKELTCKIILITKKNSNLKGLDIEKYNTQYHNLNIIYNDTFHDRYFIIDKEIIYHSGTSINHAGSKTFSVNILEDELVKETLLNKIEEITDGGKYE